MMRYFRYEPVASLRHVNWGIPLEKRRHEFAIYTCSKLGFFASDYPLLRQIISDALETILERKRRTHC